jgi:hypothetical protein
VENGESLHLGTIRVAGRPASYATAHDGPWKSAVRDAVRASGLVAPVSLRFGVRIEFRTAAPRTPNEVWDIDNLVKPTLDAMEGVFGLRPWLGVPQAADDPVDQLEAVERGVRVSEEPGAVSTSGSSTLEKTTGWQGTRSHARSAS